MRRIGGREALDWLRELRRRPGVGFDPVVGEANAWVLHAMYERHDVPGGLSHDDVHRIELAAGTRCERFVINDVDLDQQGVVVGAALGRTSDPGPGWTRLLWSELAERLGITIFAEWHYPCHRSFPYRSWPANIRPPAEGSLDREQLQRLVSHLAEHNDAGRDQECVAYYPGWIIDPGAGEDFVYELRLDEMIALYDEPSLTGSPINLWPLDRSWFVLTDWDLWGTKLSGSQALIRDIEADQELETATPPPPPN